MGERVRRFAWFVGLWVVGVTAVTMLAWLLRAMVPG